MVKAGNMIREEEMDWESKTDGKKEMNEESKENIEQEEERGLHRELSKLEEENERLRRENELLKEYRASLPLKERLYDRIPLTVRQLDIIIGVLLAGLIFVVALGLLDR